MTFPIAALRDDFENNTIDPPWSKTTTGSATGAETGGQAVFTLPSSTAGSHDARYTSNAAYDLTGDQAAWSIGTMVATGVAATAYMQLVADSANLYDWVQVSGTLAARKTVAGVTTNLFTVAWSATTHKYLRIRESGGTVFFDTSTSASAGAAWTNRASVAVSGNVPVTALTVQFGASCGNVASPGSLRLDLFNTVLPAPTSTWRYTTADWQISNRLRPVTLASDGGKLGVLVTADSMDASGVLGGTVRYFAGPLGSSSGGYLALVEYASLALAQASAFPIPTGGRVDLPAFVDARYMRLYHRSTDGSAHPIREFVPRRMIQAEDIEAESISAINIAAHTITADQIGVVNLNASAKITAGSGVVVLDNTGIDIDVGTLTTYSALHAYGFTSGGVDVGAVYGHPTASGQMVGMISQPPSGQSNVAIDAVAQGASNAVINITASAGANAPSVNINANSNLVDIAAGTLSITGGGLSASGGGSFGDAVKPPRSSGTALFAIDGTNQGSSLTIANNATATPFSNANNFSGLLIVNDTNVTGSCGIFVVGASIAKIAESSGANFTTTSGSAGKINVYLNAGAVTIENKNGGSITFNVLGIRSRTTA